MSEELEELEYNSSLAEVNDALEKLRLFAKKSGRFLEKIERNALKHLFFAASSLLDGTNGMKQDRDYGVKLMRQYFEETRPLIDNNLRKGLEKLPTDPTYSATDFIKEFQSLNRKPKEADPVEILSRLRDIQLFLISREINEFETNSADLAGQKKDS